MMRFILPIPEKLLEKGFAMPRIDRAGLIPRKIQTKKGYWQTFYIRPIEEHEMEGAAKGRTKQSDYFIRDMSEMDVARVRRNEDALRTFYKTNDRLIGAMVRNWIDRLYAHKPKMSRADEDAQQVGRLALWEAVSTFDPKKAITLSTTGEPATFGTYAYRRLRDALHEYFVPAATKKRGGMGVDVMSAGPGEVSLDKPVAGGGEEGDEVVSLGETIAAHEPVAMDEAIFQRMNADRILQEVYQKLNPTQSKVLQILIENQRTSGRPATHSAVAKQLGMTRQGVEKHLARIKTLSGWVMREMYPAKTASQVIENIVAEEMLKAIESLGLTDVPDDVLEKVGERMEKALFENIVTLEKALQEPKIGWVMRVGQSLLAKAKRIFVKPSLRHKGYYRNDPRTRKEEDQYDARAKKVVEAFLSEKGVKNVGLKRELLQTFGDYVWDRSSSISGFLPKHVTRGMLEDFIDRTETEPLYEEKSFEKSKRIFVKPSAKRKGYYRQDPREKKATMAKLPDGSGAMTGTVGGQTPAAKKEHPYDAWKRKQGMKPLDFKGNYWQAVTEDNARRKKFYQTPEGQALRKQEDAASRKAARERKQTRVAESGEPAGEGKVGSVFGADDMVRDIMKIKGGFTYIPQGQKGWGQERPAPVYSTKELATKAAGMHPVRGRHMTEAEVQGAD